MSQKKEYLPWNNDSLVWGTVEYIWSEVAIIIEVSEILGGGGGGLILDPENPWKDIIDKLREKRVEEKKQKEFLKIVTKVNGIITSDRKPISSIERKIKVDHIRKTFETFGQKVEVKVKNIRKG